ncbi:alpha/beta fold hydrolase [Phenylobacterium sp.]|uniref:alpha/beta fold hydrolase n=1 Tax=Phenylobacterium sp. TaxID=1871053 RepID=UPI002FCABCD4
MDHDLLRKLGAARGIAVGDPPAVGRARNGDLELSYLDWGGEGPTAIFLHGGSLSARTWDLVCSALRPRLRCVAMDLRGHGDSGWADDYRIAASVGDVLALTEHLGAARPHLVGMSLGGCVAGHSAAALGGRAASLTFVDVVDHVDFGASVSLRGFMGAITSTASVEEMVARALAVSPQTDPDLMLYRYQALMKAGPDGFGLRQDRRRPPDFPHILGKLADLEGLAPTVACPVLVVRGARSRIVTDDTASAFAGRFPDGRWCVIPDAGHNVQEDNPVALAEALADHISRS